MRLLLYVAAKTGYFAVRRATPGDVGSERCDGPAPAVTPSPDRQGETVARLIEINEQYEATNLNAEVAAASAGAARAEIGT